MPTYTTSGLESMEISWLLIEAILAASTQRNQMPLAYSPGAPIICGSDMTTFLYKYESLAAFTSPDTSISDAITMFPYYCVECSAIRDTVVMMRGYVERDWAALKKEMLDALRYTDSRPDSLVYTRQNLENLCAEFGGRDDTESLKSFLRTCDHISGVVTECGMMVEYDRTEMLLCALPKRLWRKAITKLGFNPLDLRTFDYGKLKDWITSKISAAEAVAMFEFVTPTAAPMTTNGTTAPPTSPASTVFPTSIASPTPLATMASTSATAPTSTSASLVSSAPSVSSTPATPKTHMTSPALLVSPAALPSPAPFAPAAAETTTRIPMAAKVPSTTVIITALSSAPSPAARQGTIHAGPTVRLRIIRVEPPRGPRVCRHRFVQPKHRQESALPNRPQPTSPFNQKPAPPPSHQDPVQPPQQRDVPPCHYCNGQHHLRNCDNLRADLEDCVVSINNHDRLVLERAG
jgi:hypothetical protein